MSMHVPVPPLMDADQLLEALDSITEDARDGDPDARRFMTDLRRHRDQRNNR